MNFIRIGRGAQASANGRPITGTRSEAVLAHTLARPRSLATLREFPFLCLIFEDSLLLTLALVRQIRCACDARRLPKFIVWNVLRKVAMRAWSCPISNASCR